MGWVLAFLPASIPYSFWKPRPVVALVPRMPPPSLSCHPGEHTGWGSRSSVSGCGRLLPYQRPRPASKLRYHAACRHPFVSEVFSRFCQPPAVPLALSFPSVSLTHPWIPAPSSLPPSGSLCDSHFPWAFPTKFSSTDCQPPLPLRSSLQNSGQARTRGQAMGGRTSALPPGAPVSWPGCHLDL